MEIIVPSEGKLFRLNMSRLGVHHASKECIIAEEALLLALGGKEVEKRRRDQDE